MHVTQSETRSYTQSHTAPSKGANYDRHHERGATAFYWQGFERKLLEMLFARFQAEGRSRYLDFACGTGRILEVGAGYFSHCVGIDVSESMLLQARSKVPNARLIRADVLQEPIDVGQFDVITLFRFVLNAEPELRDNVLRWLRGVLAPDGVVVLNNHRNAVSLRGTAYRCANALAKGRKRKVLHDHELRDVLRKHGLSVVEQFGFKCLPSWRNHLLAPGLVLRVAERALASRPTSRRFLENQVYVCRRSSQRPFGG